MDWEFDELLKSKLRQHLNLRSNWFGDPKDSSFGIYIDLCWNGETIATTAINFINDDKIC